MVSFSLWLIWLGVNLMIKIFRYYLSLGRDEQCTLVRANCSL